MGCHVISENLSPGPVILALAREVNVATKSIAISAEQIKDSGKACQSLIFCGKRLPSYISVSVVRV